MYVLNSKKQSEHQESLAHALVETLRNIYNNNTTCSTSPMPWIWFTEQWLHIRVLLHFLAVYLSHFCLLRVENLSMRSCMFNIVLSEVCYVARQKIIISSPKIAFGIEQAHRHAFEKLEQNFYGSLDKIFLSRFPILWNISASVYTQKSCTQTSKTNFPIDNIFACYFFLIVSSHSPCFLFYSQKSQRFFW